MLKKFLSKRKKSLGVLMAAMVALAMLPGVASADAVDFTGTDVGISVTDVIQTGISFMQNVIPDFIMVGLGIIMAVVIIGFLFWIVSRIRKASPGK